MSDQEEHAPSAPVSEIGDDEAGSDAEQAFSAHKRRKTGLTKRYRLMDSACQICIPKGSMMTPTTRDMTVRETYTQFIVLSSKVFLVC